MSEVKYDRQLPVLIGDIYRRWRAALDSIAKRHALTRLEWHVLSKLECRGPRASQQQLSLWLGIDNAQLTRLLNKLETKGFIVREIDSNNRRQRYVALADASTDSIAAMVNMNAKIHTQIMEELTAEEQTQLVALLAKVDKVTASLDIDTE